MVGAVGGALGGAAIARAGGSVASNPELLTLAGIGAVSSIAGKEASKFAATKTKNRFIQAESGGAAGGAAAGGLTAAAAAGGVFGAEAMVPLDFETLGLASVAGATVGAGISAVGYELGKLGIHF